MLSLCCCMPAFSSCSAFSLRWLLLEAQALGWMGCGSHRAWAYLPHGIWDLPGPGIKLVSPSLEGRFLTSGMPGKPGISAVLKTVSPQTPKGIHRIDWESLEKISFIGQNWGRDSVTQEHPQRPCSLSSLQNKSLCVCVCVCVCVVKGSNEHTHPQGAGQNPEGWGMEEETTKPLHLQKEQGYILGSEILTKPHPWDSWTPGPTNTEAYSENTHPCYSPRNIN